MKKNSYQILKAWMTKLCELETGSLRALELFVTLYLFWFRDVDVIDANYSYAAFDNRRPAKQYSS